jgi:hypothetical protein
MPILVPGGPAHGEIAAPAVAALPHFAGGAGAAVTLGDGVAPGPHFIV